MYFFKNKRNVLGLEAIKLDVNVKYNSKNACNNNSGLLQCSYGSSSSCWSCSHKAAPGIIEERSQKYPFPHCPLNSMDQITAAQLSVFYIKMFASWYTYQWHIGVFFFLCSVFHTPSHGSPARTVVRKGLVCFTNFTHFLLVQEEVCPEELIFLCLIDREEASENSNYTDPTEKQWKCVSTSQEISGVFRDIPCTYDRYEHSVQLVLLYFMILS